MIPNGELRLPAPKVRDGHVSPSAPFPVTRTLVADTDATSEDGMSTNSEDVSLDSSPENSRVSSAVGRTYGRNSSYYTYSEVSSSRETLVGAHEQTGPRFDGDTEEDESTDSASSSQFSPPPAARRINGGVSQLEQKTDGRATVDKEVDETFSSEEVSDIPSAPPFSGAAEESEEIKPATSSVQVSEVKTEDCVESRKTGHFTRPSAASESSGPPDQHPARLPTFHASSRGPWHAVVSYDACVRLCLHAWSTGCMEAPMFLENECALLREAFGLQQLLLQSEEELLAKRSSQAAHEGVAPKPKKNIGKMKLQVRRVKTVLDGPTGCSISSLKPSLIKFEKIRIHFSNMSTRLFSGWRALRKIHVRVPANGSSLPRQSLAYVHASTQYLKQVSGLLKTGVTSLRNNSASYDVVQETYSCKLRLKSLAEDDAVMMQPGSGESHVFFPDSHGDDLIVEILDPTGKDFGRVLVQLANISEDSAEKLRWWSVFREPEHQLVGKLQLYIDYSASFDDNSHLKCGSVAETVAYDLVLEVALKMQRFQQRNLLLYGSWKWLLEEFASYYGISDVYTKLRYLSYVMDVATPTSDCLQLVHDLLTPVIMKGNGKSALSHQENRLLGEIDEQIQQILASAFENYKSLDELSFTGMKDVFESATGTPAPAIESAVKLYGLLNDVLTPEAQLKLCRYFQAASKKRSRRHLLETNDLLNNRSEGAPVDPMALPASYQKMKSLILSLKNEISTDIAIHNCNVLPSFIDLPNHSAAIYSVDLCNRLREFLLVWPPPGPSPAVVDLVITTADFQGDISSWNINPIKGGVNAKELFYSYITTWIEEKRRVLYELCKLETTKACGEITGLTSPFVDEMYERLNGTLDEYDIIIRRWPEYAISLEKVVADAEKAIVEGMEKQFAEILSPLKESKIFGLKIVQKFTKGTPNPYSVPKELGVLLNSMKRVLDILRPSVENRFKSWNSYIPDGENRVLGERLSEVTVLLRAKFRSYMQALVEKLAENTRIQSHMKLKTIIHDLRETTAEPDVRNRMTTLKDLLDKAIDHLHGVFLPDVFVSICRGIWDRLGQDVLRLLEDRKDNVTWHKGPRIAVSVLDEIFATQMQSLLGNALKPQHLEPPRSMMELRWMLCKDSTDYREGGYNY